MMDEMVRFRAENPEWACCDDETVKGTLAYALATLSYRIEETSWIVRWYFRRDLKWIQSKLRQKRNEAMERYWNS